MTIEERQEAAKWFQNRAIHTTMPGAKMMFKRAAEALTEGIQPQRQPPTEDDYAYCAECNSVEMCRCYPLYGCEFRSLPSAQTHWIQCSEGLPGVNGSYLVTVHPNYIVPGGIHVDMLSWFNGKWWFDLDGQDAEFPDPIIAWMPLPEPYGGDAK